MCLQQYICTSSCREVLSSNSEESSFDWTFDDKETCLLLEGEVTVTPDGGEPVKFGAGDLVVFQSGMDCRWDVHKAVRKHYRFGD